MAIIIPSKDIYEINNQKVVDNEVDNIEITAKNVVPNNQYNISVYNKDIYDGANYSKNAKQTKLECYVLSIPPQGRDPFYGEICIYLEMQTGYLKNVEVVIPKKSFTSVVSDIYTLTDTDGNANIKYTVTYKKQEYNVSGKFYSGQSSNAANSETSYISDITETENGLPKTESGTISEDEIIQFTETITKHWEGYDRTATATISEKNETNLKSAVYRDDENNYYITLTILSGIKKLKMSRSTTAYNAGQLSNPRSISGTSEVFTPRSVEVTIYGNTIGIDLQNETVKIGDGQHVYSFEGNELMQSNPQKMTYGISVGRQIGSSSDASIRYYLYSHDEFLEDLIEGDILKAENGDTAEAVNFSSYGLVIKTNANSEFANMSLVPATMIVTRTTKSAPTLAYTKVLHEWQSGKEVATIKCAIDKYGENIDPATSNMTFHIGDTVIPYVMGADGHDKPMSLYADKTPKEFNVIGKGIIADGEIMQELTLQEIPKNE